MSDKKPCKPRLEHPTFKEVTIKIPQSAAVMEGMSTAFNIGCRDRACDRPAVTFHHKHGDEISMRIKAAYYKGYEAMRLVTRKSKSHRPLCFDGLQWVSSRK